jgi:hypothetical protein
MVISAPMRTPAPIRKSASPNGWRDKRDLTPLKATASNPVR